MVFFPMNSSGGSQSDLWRTQIWWGHFAADSTQHKFKFLGSTCPSLHALVPSFISRPAFCHSQVRTLLYPYWRKGSFLALSPLNVCPLCFLFLEYLRPSVMLTSFPSLGFTLLLSDWKTLTISAWIKSSVLQHQCLYTSVIAKIAQHWLHLFTCYSLS